MISELFGINLDDSSTSLTLDDSSPMWYLDADSNSIILIQYVDSLSYPSFQYIARNTIEIDLIMNFDFGLEYSDFINLLPLIPEKFRDSVLLQEFLYEIGIISGIWVSSIADIQYLFDPYSVDQQYIQYLADLVNLQLTNFNTASLQNLQKQLIEAIDWIKVKGTYKGIKLLSYLNGLNVNINDMYTNDYVNFVEAPWFVATAVGQNPPGFDSSYYKAPYFGYEIVLDILYSPGSGQYLWLASMFDNIDSSIDKVRPVNTVPIYDLLIMPQASESGVVVTVPGDIKSIVTENWHYSSAYLDGGATIGGSGSEMYVDISGDYLDSSLSAFLSSITNYVLGTGNIGVTPFRPGFALQTPVYYGTGVTYVVTETQYQFTFTVPVSVVQPGITEMGLYNSSGDLIIAVTFPNVDKAAGYSLKFMVIVNKST